MPKKLEEPSAPGYMALYGSLMTLLLAFFILLNSLASVQEGGFKSGIGQVQNAFGWQGGFGLLRYSFLSSGGAEKPGDQDEGVKGMDKDSMKGKGGGGVTDVDYRDSPNGQYLKMRLPDNFPDGSSRMTPELVRFLDRVGLWLMLFQYKITIKCFAGDTGNLSFDRDLALNRALKIKAYLQLNCKIPEPRIAAVGYPEARYVAHDDKDREAIAGKRQAIFFYIFKKTGKNAENSAL